MAYAELSDLRRYIDIQTDDDDDLLRLFLDQATTDIDTATGRRFEVSSDTTRYFDPTCDVDGYRLYLDDDLYIITSIVNGDGVTLETTDYHPAPRSEKPYYAIDLASTSGIAWTYTDDPVNAISVTGRWAYREQPPADVIGGCAMLAAYYYRRRDNAGDLDRTVVVGNATLSPAQWPVEVRAMIERRKRHIIGARL